MNAIYRTAALSTACLLASFSAHAADTPSNVPVLIELFTSEGCSSCPPADQVLAKLDQIQALDGAQFIVLSEHVDYWDHDGWKDPFSSHSYTERQSEYGSRLGVKDIYTPQMVVDGRAQLNGADTQKLQAALRDAVKIQKVPVTISNVKVENNVLTLHVQVDAFPADFPAKSANVMLAVADDHDQTAVKAGENAGKTLDNVAVVRSLTKAGKVDRKAGFSQNLTVKLNPDQKTPRVAIIVQEPDSKVWGVASAKL